MAGASSPKSLPAFLQLTRAEAHSKFVDLEWQQRNRLAQGLQQNGQPSEYARASGDEILRRNRYANIDPFQNNRVKLKVVDEAADYINASPITLTDSETGAVRCFIATQGPLDYSLAHFWRMVWHETGSQAVIVMLTQTWEAGRDKCFQYYPLDLDAPVITFADHVDDFQGSVELQEKSKDPLTRSEIRKITLNVSGQQKTVWHYLFVGWPDFLVPEGDDRAALLELIKATAEKANSSQDNSQANPRIVHCSAGVGRSGTFIALDYLLSELANGALDDLPPDKDPIADTVDDLRKQRMMMVQGEQQYKFLYEVLKEKWLERHKPNSLG